ncbi:MAG: Gfo/Idh/MocA family oxidoreductase [Atopobiaceae bacterium]|jgi:predicted dehydrogenase|nr:Gfo/Idh/MocA family oxidoreductase [Atopobiaceae bacterium]MCH4180497.1 Gfo/Idh/MocA family oxidoreductase [Atopobiaceae bacterium]MCH4214191.1 Gfo/Idh/MocA family oxidoreductase [Atopobiaceae bacterium]MCH4229464.1 Gfo/Idh/MocA family oxidoreductase [Atopobiaceae bacterium]MCH4275857.1 Gfo/Idh/MocA family oxidoreductase [Atopobiaceae bacterium]
MDIKLGIIGYGGMGKWHAENAPRAGVIITAACDINEERRHEATEAGIKVYETADELLADPEVNTVILTVPNYLHCPMCLKAAAAGKNVITEKPAAMSVAELDEMSAACEKAGVFFTSHQNRRWDKDMLIVKKAYDEHLLGNIFTIESKLHSGNGYMHEWHLYKKYGGGMIYDWGVHLIDQILFMMPDAKITSLYADIKNVLHEEVDDYFKILLKMDNGVTAHIELSTYILKYQPRWLVGGDKGTMVIDNFACDGSIYRTGKLLEKLPPQITETEAGPTRQFAPVPPGGIVTEPLPFVETDWLDFYRNVNGVLNGKEESLIKIPEVRRVLSVMEAARESAATGKAILF